jgi:hypothetical protein
MVSSFQGRSLCTLALAGLSLGLWGCPDTEGKFDGFVDTYDSLYGNAGSGGNAAGTCIAANVPDPGEIDGVFMFALSAGLDRGNPVLLHLDLTTSDDGSGGLQVSLQLQPLSAVDRTTQLGEVTQHGPFAVSGDDGSFNAPLGVLTIPGEGNPFSDNELVANATLDGVICRPGDFICGDASGAVTAPIDYDLTGSTFTFERQPSPGEYVEPPRIDCAGRTARPKQ